MGMLACGRREIGADWRDVVENRGEINLAGAGIDHPNLLLSKLGVLLGDIVFDALQIIHC